MKVEPSNEIENKIKKFIDFFKEHFDKKENVENIKIYFGSNEIFDCEKFFNKNDSPVDSEKKNDLKK